MPQRKGLEGLTASPLASLLLPLPAPELQLLIASEQLAPQQGNGALQIQYEKGSEHYYKIPFFGQIVVYFRSDRKPREGFPLSANFLFIKLQMVDNWTSPLHPPHNPTSFASTHTNRDHFAPCLILH